MKTTIERLCGVMLTRGRLEIYYIKEAGRVVHTSYVMPKNWRYKFMPSGAYIIGPSYTLPEWRGRRLFIDCLGYITGRVAGAEMDFYAFIHPDNIASIRGVTRAGFVMTPQKVCKKFGRWCLC